MDFLMMLSTQSSEKHDLPVVLFPCGSNADVQFGSASTKHDCAHVELFLYEDSLVDNHDLMLLSFFSTSSTEVATKATAPAISARCR